MRLNVYKVATLVTGLCICVSRGSAVAIGVIGIVLGLAAFFVICIHILLWSIESHVGCMFVLQGALPLFLRIIRYVLFVVACHRQYPPFIQQHARVNVWLLIALR